MKIETQNISQNSNSRIERLEVKSDLAIRITLDNGSQFDINERYGFLEINAINDLGSSMIVLPRAANVVWIEQKNI